MRLIVICGMHRSGTSAVAAAIERLGAHFGSQAELLPPAEDNPRGFWEHRGVKELSDSILRHFGGTWQDPPALPPGWHRDPALADHRRTAIAIIDDLASRDHEIIAMKDPRLSLTLPLWDDIVDIDHVVHPVRDPRQVIASLVRRNGFDSTRAADLWTRYVASGLRAAPHAHLVWYPEIVGDDAQLDTLARSLDLPGDTAEASEILEPELAHHDDSPRFEGPSVTLAELVYQLLRAEGAERLTPLFADLEFKADAKRSIELLEERLDATRRELQDAAQDAANAETEATRLEEELHSREVELEFLTARVQRRDIDLNDARDEMRRMTAELDEAREAIARRRNEIQELDSSLADLRTRASDLETELAREREERRAQSDRADRLQRRYERLSGRRSVRAALAVAAPARPVFRAVRALKGRLRADGPPGGEEDGEREPAADSLARRGHARATDLASRIDLDRLIASLHEQPPVSIVVPVHDAVDELRACIDSLIENTTVPSRLLIIDDASTDPEVATYLDEIGTYDGVTVLRNDHNLGFTSTVNRGFDAAGSDDVVILNSDTRVTPRWLQRLRVAAYQDPSIATVTPLSNNAGAFSAPTIGTANEIPPGWSLDEVARAVARNSSLVYPETPTGNGFCMYVKRAVLDDVRGFDAEAFPRGYGEENDLCMRALRAGWRHVVDDATYIHHVREASFGEEKAELIGAGRAVVDERYPDYTERVRAFVSSPEMETARRTVETTFERLADDASVDRRILYVIHEGRGGTPSTNEDLVRGLRRDHDCLVLTSNTQHIKLQRIDDEGWTVLEQLDLKDPLAFGQRTNEKYRRFVAAILIAYDIDLVHIRHLVKHSFDVPYVAGALDVPVVLSFHDYYLSCPTVHLLDDQDRFCGGICTPGDGACRIPMEWIERDAPHLKHAWVHEWREMVRGWLPHVDSFVTTSETARDVFRRSFPEIADRPFPMIEHGRDLEQHVDVASPPTPGGRIRVLVPGNLDPHKGADVLVEMKRHDPDDRIELHLLGDVPDRYENLGTVHGTYERDRFVERVRQIAPAVIAIPAIWAETYCHTLTEAWAAGVPVVASDIGALGERIRRHGGGWLVPAGDPEELADRLLQISDDPDDYAARVREADLTGQRSIGQMAADYAHLYRQTCRARQAFASPDRRSRHSRRAVRIDAHVLGTGDEHPGSVHVRSLRRLHHPELRSRVTTYIADPLEATLEDSRRADVVYIQRNAVPPQDVGTLLGRCERRQVPVVFDLDDNLVDPDHLEDAPDDWLPFVESLREIARRATVVTVSTEPLRARMEGLSARVELVPNMLDETLWLRPVPPDEHVPPPSVARFRILYMGTKTHAADLALLRPVVRALGEQLDRPVELWVVGGEPVGPGQDWYHRLEVPPGTANYPRFVTWLRRHARWWHAAVAPLEDTEFNSFKSDLKFLEYSALQLPGVYSDVPAYRGTIEHGTTGLLTKNDTDGWLDQLISLLADEDLRAGLARNAAAYVEGSRTMAGHADDYLDLVLSVAPVASATMAGPR